MKFIKKIPPTDKELSNKLASEGWVKLREPSSLGAATLISLPFALINGLISVAITFYLYTPLKEFFSNKQNFSISFTFNLFTLIYIVMIFVFVIIHELIHACFIPNAFKSDKTYLGINGFCGFVYSTEKITKNRFLVISIMPFILLSIVLPFILKILGLLNGFTVLLCLINSMASCVDCLNTCLVLFQVPKDSYIMNNGFETYFK